MIDIQAGIDVRERMVFENFARIDAGVTTVRGQTDEEPGALVLDPRDDFAREILALAGRARDVEARLIEQLLAEAARLRRVPAIVWALPRRLVIADIRERFPELADTASRLDTDGGHLVVAVAGGGAMAMVVLPGEEPGDRVLLRASVG